MPEKKEFEKLKSTNAKLRHEITELKRFNDLLAAEKKILDEILDNLPGTFYIWDDRPQLIRWNKRHDEITEYSADDYVNMVPTDFFDEDEHQKV
ncbi:MAG: PAS domain-containing protein, partial [Desulfobacterales bacterium]